MKRLVILISGRGSNMQALLRGAAAGADQRGDQQRARRRGAARSRAASACRHAVVDHRDFADRDAFDRALAERDRRSHDPHLVVLAGFMRILTPAFLARYAARLINIHPSLLPAFHGHHTHRRALQEGVKLHGCTVHFVTPELDHGPIIVQAAVPVLPRRHRGDARRARAGAGAPRLPQAVRWFLEGRLQLEGNRVRLAGECRYPDPIISPLTA